MAASRRFSSSARALWVVAGVAAALLLAALGAEAVLRDGGDDERAEVADYIAGVNRIQGGMAGELTRVNRAYAGFRAAATQPTRQISELRDAERTLGVLAQQVRALHVPEDAERLHKELLRLLSLQADFARELTQLAEYLPRLSDAQRELAPAGARVQRELTAATTPAGQARAFGRYAATLDHVATSLERLSAPPVLEPARRAEIARLSELAKLSAKLRRAIDAQQAEAVRRLSGDISRVAAARGASRAERDAVVAYNDRLKAIGAQRRAVERERIRLNRELA
jgi:hypothetical protein